MSLGIYYTRAAKKTEIVTLCTLCANTLEISDRRGDAKDDAVCLMCEMTNAQLSFISITENKIMLSY
jgi:hypothetical protein